MEFDFSFYFKEYFLFPVIMVIFSTTLLVGALFKVLIDLRKSGGQLFCGKPKGVLQALFAFIVSVILLCVSISFFQRGGKCLYSEKEDDTVRSSGMITQITTSGKYELQISVDDVEYIIATTQAIELKAGEYVELFYLPQSHFVLGIYKL